LDLPLVCFLVLVLNLLVILAEAMVVALVPCLHLRGGGLLQHALRP
jgi:hypothetical protein